MTSEKRASDTPKIIAVILAAGKSSRLRRPKQLLPFSGQTLIRHVALTALFSQATEVLVVVGAFHLRMRRELKYLDITVLRNSLWHQGMGNSLKKAVEYLQRHRRDANGYLFLLCDQPLISEAHIDAMIAKFAEGKEIIATQFADSYGVPALIHSRYAEALLNIAEEKGAKSFLEDHLSETELVPFSGASIDVDTPKDAERLGEMDAQLKIKRMQPV